MAGRLTVHTLGRTLLSMGKDLQTMLVGLGTVTLIGIVLVAVPPLAIGLAVAWFCWWAWKTDKANPPK